MAERRLPRGLLDPESQAIAEAYEAIPSVRRQTRGLLSLDPQEEQSMGQTAFEMLASFIPGVGQALAARDIERARRAGDPAAAAMAATEFLPFGRLAGMMRRPGPIMSEIDVYHGSPHRFEEFDASKIGTGEGAQAYGHGIYFAENPNVAEGYRKTLGEQQNPYKANVAMNRMAALVDEFDGDVEKAADRFMQSVYETPKTKAKMRQNLIDEFQTYSPKGQLYKADLPDEMVDRMLDWDKPLSQQPEAVQKALKAAWPDIEDYSALSGEKLYQELSMPAFRSTPTSGSSRREAAAWLREVGIPGIKYADAGSRGQGGSGTRNFVVFPGEEKKVKILKRE